MDHPLLTVLRDHPTRAVFDAAAGLLGAADPASRSAGALLLGELGPGFGAEAVPKLSDLLAREPDPVTVGWVIAALGRIGAREALGEVLSFTDHPDTRVRLQVAIAIPRLVDPADVDPSAASALRYLGQDEDPGVRAVAERAVHSGR